MQLPKQFKRKQAGFIQNFIIPGIILIGVVIAGIAMLASNSGGTDTSNEKASMLANSVVGMGLTVSGAIQRAEADGSAVTDLASLISGKYLTALPAVPQGITPPGEGDVLSYVKDGNAVKDGAGNQIGTATADDVFFVQLGNDSTANLVCNRINNKVAGVASNDDTKQAAMDGTTIVSNTGVIGVTEGCYNVAGQKTYYKVVNAK